MISRKHSHNPRLKSRKSIKKLSIGGMPQECVIKRGGTCLKEGFSLSDVLNHNKKTIESYDPNKQKNYFDKWVKTILVFIPIEFPAVYFKYKKLNYENYDFDDLFVLQDLLKLNFTLTEDDLKYIHENNIYFFFSKGLLTYGQTKRRLKELDDELNDLKSTETNKDELQKINLVIDDLKKVKQLINNLKKLCKLPVNNPYFGTHTNPACKFKDNEVHSKFHETPLNVRYADTNTHK